MEDHRELVAAQRAQLLGAEHEQLASVEADAARNACVLGMQALGGRRDGLARPRLPNDAERAPGPELIVDPVDGAHDAVLGGELDAQNLDAQQRIARGGARIHDRLSRHIERRAHLKRTRGSRNA